MRSRALAHIVGGGPTWPLWLTGILLFGGAVAAMAVPLRLRRAALGVAAVGLVATIAVYALLPSSPTAPPGLSIRIAAPPPAGTVTNPVLVKVCGGTANLPGSGRLLSISVDGRQVAEVEDDTAAVRLAPGRHLLRVEVVTSAHVEYAPPVSTDETITVDGIGTLSSPPDCVTGAPQQR